jgi:HAE1 family hydrophobic/amphiphilic exporter-1
LRFDLPRRQIEVAKKNLSLTDAQFRQRAIEVITSVQRSYWDLVFALRNLQIQRDSLADSRQQLEHNKRMVAEGTLAPIDEVAAENQVATFEQAEFAALEDVNRAENNLKNMIAENQEAKIWSLSLIPTDQADLTLPQVSLPEAMNAAKQNRQELKQSDLAREINLLDQKLYRDLSKPEIDLVGSYGVVGNAGSQVTTPNPLTASNDAQRARVNELSVLAGLQPLPRRRRRRFHQTCLVRMGNRSRTWVRTNTTTFAWVWRSVCRCTIARLRVNLAIHSSKVNAFRHSGNNLNS